MKRSLTRCVALISCICFLIATAPSVFALDADGKRVETPSTEIAGASLKLVKDGQPQATIVVASAATDKERQAALEVQSYIRDMSGAQLSITEDVYGTVGIPIYIGKAAPDAAANKAAVEAGGNDPDSFRLLVTEQSVQLNGLSDLGTLYAAFELLEQLGVRWFMPGEIGTVVPSTRTVALRIQDTIQHPAFDIRMTKPDDYQIAADIPKVYDPTERRPWSLHMRLDEGTIGKQDFPCTITKQQRPDLYLKDEKGQVSNHLDVTKPEVLECVVQGSIKELKANPGATYLSMAPKDGIPPVLIPDPNWDGSDFDAMNGKASLTDRYVKFLNLVLERLEQAGYPNVKIAFLAYSVYQRPPVRWTPNPRIVPMIAPITFERLHAIGNPLSWERNYLQDLIDGWQKLGVNVVMRDYRYDLAEPGLPLPMITQIASELKYYKDHGVIGVKSEVLPAWAYQGPALYLDAKMKWNPDLDAKALLDDYFSKFYGPAAKPMQEHFDLLEKTFAEADYFTGRIYDFPHILTGKVLKELEKSLSKAEKEAGKASDPVYAQRVHMVRVSFDFGSTHLNMIDSVYDFDFAKAKQQLDRIRELRLEAVSHSPVILSPWASYKYVEPYWGAQVEDGYKRISNGGRIVAKLPDEWYAMLFPNGSGDQLGLWKPELGTQSWMKLHTYSESWSDQGLRYYMGDVWYRTSVTVPKTFNDGRPVHLWFGNIDETARVWMNGKELPIVQQGTALRTPWVFDASQAISFEQPNVIVVDTRNAVLDELGTGGIVGTAMLYQPGQ